MVGVSDSLSAVAVERDIVGSDTLGENVRALFCSWVASRLAEAVV